MIWSWESKLEWCALEMERGVTGQGLRSWNSQGNGFCPQASRGNQLGQHLDSSPGKMMSGHLISRTMRWHQTLLRIALGSTLKTCCFCVPHFHPYPNSDLLLESAVETPAQVLLPSQFRAPNSGFCLWLDCRLWLPTLHCYAKDTCQVPPWGHDSFREQDYYLWQDEMFGLPLDFFSLSSLYTLLQWR